VLDNRLANAVEYSLHGGEIVVRVACEPHETFNAATGTQYTDDGQSWATVSVTGHGIGIPSGEISHVFERFSRGSNVPSHTSGSGIGLSSARQIANQHGDTIDVQSHEGHGSTFTVRLPIRADSSAAGRSNAAP
jgi:signal transduction histidine kinase